MPRYDWITIKGMLENNAIRSILTNYCIYLSHMYNKTSEGKYRIKYNALYPVLFDTHINENIKTQMFNSFATSLNIFPIQNITQDSIYLQNI